MGLGFKHSDASWSYSGFNAFRARLASDIGINLKAMEGFDGMSSPGYPHLPAKPWDEVDDPIKPLLHHSDCDGYLTAKQCRQVAPRLRELVSYWEECYDKRQALVLAEDMENLADRHKRLIFC